MKLAVEDKPRRFREAATYLQCDCLRGQSKIMLYG